MPTHGTIIEVKGEVYVVVVVVLYLSMYASCVVAGRCRVKIEIE